MSNVKIENVKLRDSSGVREAPFDAPAIENIVSRTFQLGPFRSDNQAATATVIAKYAAASTDTDAPIGALPVLAGGIVGISVRSSAAITSGTVTARFTKNATLVGDALVVTSGQGGTLYNNDPFALYSAGDVLGVTFITAGAPAGLDYYADILVRQVPK
jgi:hypothetical protein